MRERAARHALGVAPDLRNALARRHVVEVGVDDDILGDELAEVGQAQGTGTAHVVPIEHGSGLLRAGVHSEGVERLFELQHMDRTEGIGRRVTAAGG